jgi:hypothetical protein
MEKQVELNIDNQLYIELQLYAKRHNISVEKLIIFAIKRLIDPESKSKL